MDDKKLLNIALELKQMHLEVWSIIAVGDHMHQFVPMVTDVVEELMVLLGLREEKRGASKG